MANKKVRGNGDGTYYQRSSDGRWVVEYYATDPETGKPKRMQRYAKSRKEAKQILKDIAYEAQAGQLVANNKITLSQWIQKYLPIIKNSCSPNFYYRKTSLINNHIDSAKIGQKYIQNILPIDLEEFYIELMKTGKKAKIRDEEGKVISVVSIGGLSSQTVKHIHNIINPALEKATDNGFITRNPAAKVDKKRILKLVPTRVPRPLTVEEVGKYLQNVSNRRLSSLFILDLCTGMRRGELLGLHWSDIDHEKHEIKLERQIQRIQNIDGPGSYLDYTGLKTQKSQRTIKLPLLAYNELLAHKERQDQEKADAGKGYKDEDLIFCTAIGTKLDPRRVYEIHCQTLIKANIQHRAFHDLRHTVATLLLQAGESTKSIQELLGHSDIRTTLGTYAHVFDEMKAATAEKLDGIITDACSGFLIESSKENLNNKDY